MKRILPLLIVIALVAGRGFAAEPKMNSLSKKDKTAGWQLLFDGKSLDGWKASESKGVFTVEDGCIVTFSDKARVVAENPGAKTLRSHLFYDGPVANHDFKNFEISLDIKTAPGANSGVYIHTQYQPTNWPDKGYEVQVNNTHKDPKKGAGLYAIKDNFEAPAKDGEWYTMVVKVEGKRIQTFVNGKQIVDYTEPTPAAPPENMKGRMLSHGTFALQGHDPDSKVMYRNIKVRVLP